MKPDELKARTTDFALKIIDFVQSLPKNRTCEVIGNQLLRAGTSVGANYRAACKARSKADFISKITIVEQEADATQYWLELLVKSRLVQEERLSDLRRETSELTAIFTASGKTAKRNR